jgi:hypothetical protein
MQLLTTIMSTLVIGVAFLPTALAAHSPCVTGRGHDQGESCEFIGYYTCSNNLKHLVSYVPQPPPPLAMA